MDSNAQGVVFWNAKGGITGANDAFLKLNYLLRSAVALYSHGDEKGDNAALSQAIGVYCEILAEQSREQVPLDWAMTQNNLGTALHSLGERESGTKRLEEAVAAYRAALQEYTRERAPLDWAMTQNNLGITLMREGERAGGDKASALLDLPRRARGIQARACAVGLGDDPE